MSSYKETTEYLCNILRYEVDRYIREIINEVFIDIRKDITSALKDQLPQTKSIAWYTGDKKYILHLSSQLVNKTSLRTTVYLDSNTEVPRYLIERYEHLIDTISSINKYINDYCEDCMNNLSVVITNNQLVVGNCNGLNPHLDKALDLINLLKLEAIT